MAFVLGIDVSTTASKAILVDDHGDVAGVASTAHDISSPHPLWSEQEPDDWWAATCQSIRTVVEDSGVDVNTILSIGLTGQMHGLVLLDSKEEVLRPAMLWNDQRSSAECEQIRHLVGADRLVRITGNDAFAGFSAPKLLWVRNNEPDVYERITTVLLPKDYVRLKLTGQIATDKAGAGGTLLLDLQRRDWSEEILTALEIPHEWLPTTFEGIKATGGLSEAASKQTGLAVGTVVVAGGGDQAAQAVGVGAINPATWGLTIGTSGVVFAPTDKPVTESAGRVHAFPHAVADKWHMMGVMLSAAGSLAWYRETFFPAITYDELLEEANKVDPGSEGLFFQPYLTGERTPHADPHVRGSFVGITARHTRAHMTRAVLEGVAFGLKDNFELLSGIGLPEPECVRISGGGSRSPTWRQIVCDVLGLRLETVNSTEGAAYGAALLAGVGAGIWPSIEVACQTALRQEEVVEPDDNRSAIYRQHYQRFRQLYPMLRDFYS